MRLRGNDVGSGRAGGDGDRLALAGRALSLPRYGRRRRSRAVRRGGHRVLREEHPPAPGDEMPGLSRIGQADGRAAARLAGGDTRGRRIGPGGGSGRSQGQPAHRGRPLRRRRADAAQVEAPQARDRRARAVGSDRGSLGTRRRGVRRGEGRIGRLPGHAPRAVAVLVVPAAPRGDPAVARRSRRLGTKPDRSLHPRWIGPSWPVARARGESPHADPPAQLRPDRPSALVCRGRGLRRRSRTRRVRTAGQPPSGQPALRRAVGPALARPGPIRRDCRPRVRLRHPQRIPVSRLRGPCAECRSGLRSLPGGTPRGRPARESPAPPGRAIQRVDHRHGLPLPGRRHTLAGRRPRGGDAPRR